MQHGVGLKQFGQLGPDVKDYYEPSPSAITELDRQQERKVNTPILAAKLMSLIEDKTTITALSMTMTYSADGYDMIKRLMHQHVPALAKDSRTNFIQPREKPRYTRNTDLLTFQSRYHLWL